MRVNGAIDHRCRKMTSSAIYSVMAFTMRADSEKCHQVFLDGKDQDLWCQGHPGHPAPYAIDFTTL